MAAVAPVTSVTSEPAVYDVRVNGQTFTVEVAASGELANVSRHLASAPVQAADGDVVTAALTGNILKVLVNVGDTVEENQSILVMEAMKMETEVSAPSNGTISAVHVREGDAVTVGDPLVSFS